ncbi:MFS transporter [Streptomyces sp. NK08204]|uniref:MFS transporter n=1 Tax=Streptomyces sp. NK08204 TaxID=2873260 RepID=UPI001CED7E0A|nr:MFS transporter [Streptomyces sp. NK08204]
MKRSVPPADGSHARRDAPPPAPKQGQGVVRVLTDRNFGPYLVGNLASNCGSWFQNIAQALLLYRLTHSTMLVAVANFAQFAGVLILAPWAGRVADRFDRRKLLLVVQVASLVVALTLTLVAYAGGDDVPVIMGAALLLGLGTAFATPSMQALVPGLIRREDMPTAVAMNTVTFTLARSVGPVLGALVVANWGIPAAFAVNASSYVILILALLVVRPRSTGPRPATGRSTLRATWRSLRTDQTVVLLLAVVACVAISGDPVNTLTPALATQVFHLRDTTVGILIGAFGLGSVVAAFVRQPDDIRRLAALMTVMGAATIAVGLSVDLAMALVAFFVAGFGFLSTQTAATVRLQMRVSEAERGRAMALWSMAWLGTRPLASLVDGAIASMAGVRAAAAAMALPVLLGSVLVLAVFRRPTPSATIEPASLGQEERL